MKIIEAILEGERDPEVLVALCHRSILKKKRELVIKSLNGRYTSASLFALRQAYDAYQFYRQQIKSCDERIEQSIVKINPDEPTPDLTQARKPIRHNRPHVDNLGAHLLRIFGGTDATSLPGITDYTWLQLLSETGSDLSKWPIAKHFTSHLGLAPGQHRSGKSKKKVKRKGKPDAGQIFKKLDKAC